MPFLIIKYTHHLQNHILFADCGIGRVILGCGQSNLKWKNRTVWVRILKLKDTTVRNIEVNHLLTNFEKLFLKK